MAATEARLGGIVCKPIKLKGPWDLGYALDEHTVSSVPNEFGGFDTVRSPMGQLIYDLKYGGVRSRVTKIARAMTDLIRRKYEHYCIDCLIAVPPSEKRKHQPVLSIAKKLSEMLSVKNRSSRLHKIKQTQGLKNISDLTQRQKELSGAFSADSCFAGKTVLVVDDLFRSGETVSEIVRTLKGVGAKKVLLLVATKTRVLR